MSDENDKKDIEIVEGMGNLEISPVYDNSTTIKPIMQDERPKNIVIPKVKKNIEKKKDDEDDDDEIEEESENKEE